MMGIWPRRQPWVDALSQLWVDKCGQEALLLVLEGAEIIFMHDHGWWSCDFFFFLGVPE